MQWTHSETAAASQGERPPKTPLWAGQTEAAGEQPGDAERCLGVAPASPTLCGPAACSPPGSARGVLQARGLQWAATPSSRELPDPGTERAAPPAPASQADSLPAESPGRPMHTYMSCMCYICIYVHSFRRRHHYIVWLKLIQCYMSIVN